MRAVIGVLGVLLMLTSACASDGGDAGDAAATPSTSAVRLAATTSAAESGLLDELLPAFEQEEGIDVTVAAVGSGKAIARASDGQADVVLTHAPRAEQEFVDSGDGIDKQEVMTNDFIVVGPADDPAGIRDQADAAAAMAAIARQGSTFVSRADRSGTHERELELWNSVGVDPEGEPWYVSADAGMTATLEQANRLTAYTLTDRSTFVVAGNNLSLESLFEGGSELVNVYNAIVANPEQIEGVNASTARALATYLTSAPAQQTIETFGEVEYGTPLFMPASS